MTLPDAPQHLAEAVDFVAIEINNRSMHWYPNVKSMRDSGSLHQAGALEFFDKDGYRLTPSFDEQWQITALWQTIERPHLRALRHRIHGILRDIEDRLNRTSEEDSDARRATRSEAIRCLGQLRTLSLTKLFKALSEPPFVAIVYEDDDPHSEDDRGPVHNLIFHTF